MTSMDPDDLRERFRGLVAAARVNDVLSGVSGLVLAAILVPLTGSITYAAAIYVTRAQPPFWPFVGIFALLFLAVGMIQHSRPPSGYGVEEGAESWVRCIPWSGSWRLMWGGELGCAIVLWGLFRTFPGFVVHLVTNAIEARHFFGSEAAVDLAFDLLASAEERCVRPEDIQKAYELDPTATRGALHILYHAGLVRVRQRGGATVLQQTMKAEDFIAGR